MQSQGQLVSDELIFKILSHQIQSLDDNPKVLIDGFPRTIAQLEIWERHFGTDYVIIFVNCSIEVAAARILKRDDHRSDDRKSILDKRMEVYKRDTRKLVEFVKNKGRLVEVWNEGGLEEKKAEMSEKLKELYGV